MGTPICYIGWEQGLLEADASALPAGAGNSVVSATKSRTGSYSLRCASTSSPRGRAVGSRTELRALCHVNHNLAGVSTVSDPGRSGYCITLAAAEVSQYLTFGWHPGRTELVIFHYDGTGVGTLLGSGFQREFADVDVWHEFSIAAKIHVSTGFLRLYLNGREIAGFDGDTTIGGVISNIQNVLFGGSGFITASAWSAYAYFDDCYIEDSTGEAAQPPATQKLYYAVANGNGQLSELTGSDGNSTDNYLLVDDPIGSNDGDTTHVAAAAADLDDLYTHAAITLGAGYSPTALVVNAVARKTDAPIASQISLASWKAANHAVGAAKDLTTAYAVYQEIFTALPDASAVNIANINATEIGVKSQGVYA